MIERILDDDVVVDVPHLLRRIAVGLPQLFHADGSATDTVAPLRLPAGVTVDQVLVSGIDFDGPADLAPSLRLAGLRLPRVAMYVADDDPVRSALSPLCGRIHRWPTSLEEILAFDEAHALPATVGIAMRRRVDFDVATVSIGKDILRRNDAGTALLVATCRVTYAIVRAKAARDAMVSGAPSRDGTDLAMSAARDVLTRTAAMVTLFDGFRNRIAAPGSAPAGRGFENQRQGLTKARTAVFTASLIVERMGVALRDATHTLVRTERGKRISAALNLAHRLTTTLAHVPFEVVRRSASIARSLKPSGPIPPTMWHWLSDALSSIKSDTRTENRDTDIVRVTACLDAALRLGGVEPINRIIAADDAATFDGERLFMLLHSARIEEALALFPWLLAPHPVFAAIEGGLAGGVELVLEIERCRSILVKMVGQTTAPDENRLTRKVAQRDLADHGAVHAAFAQASSLSTLVRQTAMSRAMLLAYQQGRTFDPRHPLTRVLAGQTDWAVGRAHDNPAMTATTAAALGKTPPLKTKDPWRQDVPRFFGLTISEFVVTSVHAMMPTARRGPMASTTDNSVRRIDLDASMLTLARTLLDLADPSGEERARFDMRFHHANSGAKGQGALKLGMRRVASHLPTRVAALLHAGKNDLHGLLGASTLTQQDWAPAADQCVPAFWAKPLHDLPVWEKVADAAKTPRTVDIADAAPTRRDALARELAGFHAVAPALVARMEPSALTCQAMTWLAHSVGPLSSDLDFAGLA